MYCEECGAWIDDSQMRGFCPECGRPLDIGPAAGQGAYQGGPQMGGNAQQYPNQSQQYYNTQQQYPPQSQYGTQQYPQGQGYYGQPPMNEPPRRRGSSIAIGVICVAAALIAGVLAVVLYTNAGNLPNPFGSSTDSDHQETGKVVETDDADDESEKDKSEDKDGNEDSDQDQGESSTPDENDSDDADTQDNDEAESAPVTVTPEPEPTPAPEPEPTPAPEPTVETPQHVGFKGITSVTATSYLWGDATDSSLTYYASNVLDGRADTCWQDGVSGTGVGESLTFSGNGVQTFSGFTILNGYHKDSRRYYQNSRPSSFTIYVDGAYFTTASVSDSGPGVQQRIDFSQPIDGTTITLEIAGTYSGTKYQDTSISEVGFF